MRQVIESGFITDLILAVTAVEITEPFSVRPDYGEGEYHRRSIRFTLHDGRKLDVFLEGTSASSVELNPVRQLIPAPKDPPWWIGWLTEPEETK